jgi:hypothetical protein
MYGRINPVVIVVAAGARLDFAEYNHAGRLLKRLWHVGKNREKIRGAICAAGALSPYNLAAWQCYLEHWHARQSMDALRASGLHRFAWYNMQRAVPLTWHE